MHAPFIHEWASRQRVLMAEIPPHDQRNFDRYLQWLHRSTRTHMQTPYTNKIIDEDEGEDDTADAYDEATRMETSPLQRYVVRNLNFNTTALRRSYEL